jgi:methionyl-tRNA formyltransferase
MQISIAEARVAKRASGAAGRLWSENRHLYVACGGASTLELLAVQIAGKRQTGAIPFLNGYPLTENEMLGEKP